MQLFSLSRTIAFLALTIFATAASAHGYVLGSIEISHPWARATPKGADVGAGYLSLENTGNTPDRLISVTVEGASDPQLHEMTMKDGAMTMRPLKDGILIPAGAKVELKPGGYHIMLMGLSKPLTAGEKINGTLTFEKAGKIDVIFKVEPVGKTPDTGHSHTAE